MTKEIILSQGKVALVDDEMYPFLSKFKWSMNGDYAGRTSHAFGLHRTIFMHTAIAGLIYGDLPDGYFVDHTDRNKLNNTSANIRIATRGQNMANRTGWGRTTQYKGVYQTKRASGMRWRALIQHNLERIHLGYFDTPEEAAVAYDSAALTLHGPYALCNFPNEVQ